MSHPKKIQWIHTDYARWSQFSEWSRAVTKKDSFIYSKFDYIVVLSEHCRKGMAEKFPELANKIVVIPDLIDGDWVIKLQAEICPVMINPENLNLVTVARIDREKRIDKVLELASQLKEKNNCLCGILIGDGPQRIEMEKRSRELDVENQVQFLGHLNNPYPVMSKSQYTRVLVSKYEGTPVTIDEAMVLGIGVIAPRVGGIAEQISRYENSELYSPLNLPELELLQKTNKTQFGMEYKTRNLESLEKIEKLIK